MGQINKIQGAKKWQKGHFLNFWILKNGFQVKSCNFHFVTNGRKSSKMTRNGQNS